MESSIVCPDRIFPFEGFSLSNPQGDRILACKSVIENTILFVR